MECVSVPLSPSKDSSLMERCMPQCRRAASTEPERTDPGAGRRRTARAYDRSRSPTSEPGLLPLLVFTRRRRQLLTECRARAAAGGVLPRGVAGACTRGGVPRSCSCARRSKQCARRRRVAQAGAARLHRARVMDRSAPSVPRSCATHRPDISTVWVPESERIME